MVFLPGVQYFTGQVIDMETDHHRWAMRRVPSSGSIWPTPSATSRRSYMIGGWTSLPGAPTSTSTPGPDPSAVPTFTERHHGTTEIQRFQGWWGHDKDSRFEMINEFVPIPSVEAWQLSNPAIMSMAPLVASLEVFAQAGGIGPLREKTEKMVGYMDYLVDTHLAGKAISLTPRDMSARGCQSSLRIVDSNHVGRDVFDQLQAAHIECDWRHPDVIRLAPVPLYNTFGEIYHFVTTLSQILS